MTLAFLPPCVLGMKMYYLGLKVFMLPASNLGKWFWAEHLHITHTHTPTMVYSPHLFFFFLIYLLFTVLGLCCSKTFSLWWSGATLQLWCVDFSLQWFFLMQSTGSRCRGSVAVAHSLNSCNPQAVEHRLNSCRTWALFFCYLWDLPRPAIEPTSPASVGWLFATEPPGKAQSTSFNKIFKMAPTTAGRFYHWG